MAILDGERLIASVHENPSVPQSTLLLKKIDNLFITAHLDLGAITSVLFSHGPGSFTSLRVGQATLAGLFVARYELLWQVCSSLLARCLAVRRTEETVVVLMRAGRERIYGGFLTPTGNFNEIVTSSKSITDELFKIKAPLIIAGDGLPLISDAEKLHLSAKGRLIPQDPICPEVFLTALQHPGIRTFRNQSEMRLNYLLEPDIGPPLEPDRKS